MDGFNIIPNQGQDISQNNLNSKNLDSIEETTFNPNARLVKDASSIQGVKIKSNFSLFLLLSICIFIGALGYSSFLFIQKQLLISQIVSVSNKLQDLESKINKNRIEELKVADEKLKIIKNRLSKHIVTTDAFSLINQNLRASAQISDYKMDITDTEFAITFTATTPTFKDMTEQTEKLLQMKNRNQINSFVISNLSYEQDTKRVKFTIKLNLDKAKFSAENIAILNDKI